MKNKSLANLPDTTGISKNKVLMISTIICSIILIALLYGTSDDNDNEVSDNKINNQQYYSTNSAQNIDSVINTSKQLIARENASQTLKLDTLTEQPKQQTDLSSNKSDQNKSEDNKKSIIVPPISDTDAQQFKTQEVQAEQQFKLKQRSDKYAAFSSKSVVFNKSERSNSSARDNKATETSSDSSKALSNNPSSISPDSSNISPTSSNSDQNNQVGKQSFAANSADKTINLNIS